MTETKLDLKQREASFDKFFYSQIYSCYKKMDFNDANTVNHSYFPKLRIIQILDNYGQEDDYEELGVEAYFDFAEFLKGVEVYELTEKEKIVKEFIKKEIDTVSHEAAVDQERDLENALIEPLLDK